MGVTVVFEVDESTRIRLRHYQYYHIGGSRSSRQIIIILPDPVVELEKNQK